jgi:polyphosphate kinase 2 (PPK2 family)
LATLRAIPFSFDSAPTIRRESKKFYAGRGHHKTLSRGRLVGKLSFAFPALSPPRAAAMPQPLIPPPGEKVVLADYDPRDKSLAEGKAEAKQETRRNVKAIRDLSQRLWAEDRRAVLVILQGMDTSGKDGTIKHVLTGVNPQMCQVTAFKQPSDEERDHDFLWRIHRAIPRRGALGIFNRSHYEDVLAARVHRLVPEHVWRRRYDAINQFEQLLTADATTIV